MKRKPIKFDGFDWTELWQLKSIASSWPCVPKGHKFDKEAWLAVDEQKKAFLIKQYLSSLVFEDSKKKELVVVAKYVRQWLLACAKCKTYDAPVFKGFAACRSDDQMLRWVAWNLECLWT